MRILTTEKICENVFRASTKLWRCGAMGDPPTQRKFTEKICERNNIKIDVYEEWLYDSQNEKIKIEIFNNTQLSDNEIRINNEMFDTGKIDGEDFDEYNEEHLIKFMVKFI